MRLDEHLAPRAANHRPLTPTAFLTRALAAHPDRLAVVWGERRWSWRGFGALAARFMGWLRESGIDAGDVVSVMVANRPEMLAAHYAVPGLGAVLNTINTRLDAEAVAYILDHSGSRLIVADGASAAVAREAAARAGVPAVILGTGAGAELDLLDGPEDLLFEPAELAEDWRALCLNYTSGTTGRPKGVVYHHRGAYLNALGNAMALGFDRRTAYLWTLPMFHCNGWCHTWAVTAAGGVHVCLDRPDPALIFMELERHGVTHFACAPVVLYMLLNHPERPARPPERRVRVATGGASPTSALIEGLDALGFDIVHLYGLTECYGPATICDLPEEMRSAGAAEKAAFLARQGVSHPTAGEARVVDPEGRDVPADGRTTGEIVLAGDTLMAGYYRDPEATERSFAGGVFHTGDLAVRHPDGAIEIRDRLKDVIISGGENVSSLEVESVLHQHPAVLLAAVVAASDPKWGEIPCAFVELKPGERVEPEALQAFCRERLAGFKTPRRFVFTELPKTATGKIQKFVLRKQAAAPQGAP